MKIVKDQERSLISVRNVMEMVLWIVLNAMVQESIDAYSALDMDKKNAIVVMVAEERSAQIVAVAGMTYGENAALGVMELDKNVVHLVLEPAMKNV